MNKKYGCAKCEKIIGQRVVMAEGGDVYTFCHDCANKIEELPTGSISEFMREVNETGGWVAHNIASAKSRRAKGIRLWA